MTEPSTYPTLAELAQCDRNILSTVNQLNQALQIGRAMRNRDDVTPAEVLELLTTSLELAIPMIEAQRPLLAAVMHLAPGPRDRN